MAGFDNDVVYGINIDLSGQGGGLGGNSTLITNGQLLIASTALNAGGTHVNVGVLTSPDGSITVGYSSPNITLQVAGGTTVGKTITGDIGGPLAPVLGNWNIFGAVAAAGTNPIRTSGSGNTLAVQVQKSQAVASTNASNIGLAAFNSAQFSVDANGFVQLAGSTTNSIKKVVRQVFISSGTYTPTANMLYCDIQVVGGGGGSGGCGTTGASQLAASGGGGGGGFAQGVFSAATIGVSQTVTIGAGGLAGTAGANTGGTGGTSSVGALISATGGLGGVGAAGANINIILGGAGGAGANGDYQTTGAYGLFSQWQFGLYVISGAGGSSFFGGGAPANAASASAAVAGISFGGGAAGGIIGANTGQIAGAAGAKGVVIITEYVG